jgi:glucose-6-phosphate isomerase
MQHAEHLDDLISDVSARISPRHKQSVLLGMGGSASGAGMILEAHGVSSVEILDTSHPDTVQRESFEGHNVIASSKSGGTIETICALAYALDRGLDPRDLTVITDPGTQLAELGESLGATVLFGDPHCGGRFSALSVFAIAPALIAGIAPRNLEEFAISADVFADAFVRGFETVTSQTGAAIMTTPLRDNPLINWAALWEEQLIAESTGKSGRGVVPLAGRLNEGENIQETHARVVGMCVALGVDPFDQPDVEQAKQRTFDVLAGGIVEAPEATEDSVRQLIHESDAPLVLQVFGPLSVAEGLANRWRQLSNDRIATAGIGPRYLHSTGQLHKGGPEGFTYLQIFVEPQVAPERITGRHFSFHDLIRAQSYGDYVALREAGREVLRHTTPNSDSLFSLFD